MERMSYGVSSIAFSLSLAVECSRVLESPDAPAGVHLTVIVCCFNH
jgi:hypothetical protein